MTKSEADGNRQKITLPLRERMESQKRPMARVDLGERGGSIRS